MKKILLVYNPVAGGAEFKKNLDGVIENFQRRGILLTLYRTRAKDSEKDFAECIKISDAAGIIAAGGDGTLHNVINWLKKSGADLPVGLIGSGTSNDFAAHLNLDAENIFDAVAENRTRAVDLGEANGEYFINVAAAGAFTSIAHEVDSRQKNSLGKLAYYLHGLGEIPALKSFALNVRADGKNFELDAFLFLVLNSPSVAGFKKISSVAQIDDGKLDLLALKKCSPRDLLRLTQKILSGKCIEQEPNVFFVQAEKFEIHAAVELTGDLDGEIGGKLPLKIQTVRAGLNFFVNQ
ncbi:MAG: YegS/Rv2252/BmrU family lipid kinase [Selenomonadaceae bacterium]|nr:YegS/Rv2252/BmrU family lipid kinase [Selenomonadaceae bacterium]